MSTVEYELLDGVAMVTFNRPDSLNAFDDEMHSELAVAWSRIAADPDVRAIIITGTGRGFCVGMDLKRVGERGFRTPTSERIADANKLTPLNNDIWLPVIVAVNGVCAGGGLHFVADADVVLASADASFVDTHVGVGQVAALEPISLIPRIGLGNALKLAVLGRAGKIDAAEALRIGLVDEVTDPDGLLDRARELARAAAAGSPAAIERTKRAIRESLELPLSEAMQAGWESVIAHRDHPDALEGPRAFAEKRPPRWTTSKP